MVNKMTSVKEVIGKVFRDFRPERTDWVGDAIEWCGEVLHTMGSYTATEKTNKVLTVADYKTAMPCNLEAILGVEYNGRRLPYGGDITMFNLWCEDRSTVPEPNSSTVTNLLPGNSQSVEELNSSPLRSATSSYGGFDYYAINPGYIITSFAEGEIKLHYNRYAEDDDGWPLVPDTIYSKQAMSWYIMRMLTMQGMAHPTVTWQLADHQYELFLARARNDNAYPSVDKMDRLRRQWVRLIPPEHAVEDFFIGMEDNEKVITKS